MTLAQKRTPQYAIIHDKLREEVRIHTIDPEDPDTWLMTCGAMSDVMGLLGLSDDALYPHLDDLRRIAMAINQRITSMED